MKHQPLMILSHCRKNLRRHYWVQAQIPRRLYHHSNRKSNNPRHDETTTNGATVDHDVLSTIPRMGRGLKVGQYATATRTYSREDVDSFGGLIRDYNPLHSSVSTSPMEWWGQQETGSSDDEQLEQLLDLQQSILEKTGIIQPQKDGGRKVLVHGIFVSGIFSSIFASIAPGCVYINQSLDFCGPVFVEDTVVGCIHIEKIRDWSRRKGGIVAECHTRVFKLMPSETTSPSEAELVIRGSANVWLPIGQLSK